MKEMLLCSHNPLLIKNLYGMLRDEGYGVEIAEHPAFAVQMVLAKDYAFIIFDSEPFGLSVEEAIQIISKIAPEIPVFVVGEAEHPDHLTGAQPLDDLEEIRRTIHAMHRMTA